MHLPQHVLISHQGTGHDFGGVVTVLPNIGESLQMFLDSGKVMRTSPVVHVEEDGEELVIDTQNSRYRLRAAS